MPPVSAPSLSVRFAHGGALALIAAVFALTIVAVTLQLRSGVREQILRREADMLAAIASMQLDNGAPDDAPGALLAAVLKTSKMRGVSGVRIFDGEQRLDSAFPWAWSEDPPAARDWSALVAGGSVARLLRGSSAEEIVGLPAPLAPAPALEAWVPLRRAGAKPLIGVAQFVLAGDAVARDMAEHDRRLWTQAAIAWVAGSAVIALVLGWALRRLERANRELRTRGEDLERANRELVLAAKTSALGAVTAHLFHELKNPLAGLESIMAGGGDVVSKADGGGELAAASALTRRLRTMVNDVVGVLRDEQMGARFRLTCADIGEIVVAKVRSEAEGRGVRLEVSVDEGVTVAGRRANLAVLVLRNLLQNAIEATPASGVVRLEGRGTSAGGAEFLVEDTAGGLPESVRARLFQPCASAKPGGSGLGLALSHQLATQAGGRLELRRSDARGACFGLVLNPEA